MKIDWAIKFLEELLEENPEFTGSVQLNFFKGNVANINELKSHKPQPKKQEGE